MKTGPDRGSEASAPAVRDLPLAGPGGVALHGRLWQPQGGGARAPIVLLHDSLGCVALWRDFPAQLSAATGREVLAYDRWGFGRSDARTGLPGTGFVREEGEQVVPRLLAQCGRERAVLLGHSVGGGMAAFAAAHLGSACEALVTVSAQCYVEERTLEGIRAAEAAFADEAEMDRLRKYHGDKARWVLDAWTRTWLSPAHAGYSMEPALARVHCPTLVIHGAEDEYGSPQQAGRIAASVRGSAELAVLPGCHHLPHRERAAEVLERIAAFLARSGSQA